MANTIETKTALSNGAANIVTLSDAEKLKAMGTDERHVNGLIDKAIKAVKATTDIVVEAAAGSVLHYAKFGRYGPMNKLYNGLMECAPNMAEAYRNYCANVLDTVGEIAGGVKAGTNDVGRIIWSRDARPTNFFGFRKVVDKSKGETNFFPVKYTNSQPVDREEFDRRIRAVKDAIIEMGMEGLKGVAFYETQSEVERRILPFNTASANKAMFNLLRKAAQAGVYDKADIAKIAGIVGLEKSDKTALAQAWTEPKVTTVEHSNGADQTEETKRTGTDG